MPQSFLALIPAAGIGARSGVAGPKQYASLNGEAMLVHCIRAFIRVPAVAVVRVVLASDDRWADSDAAWRIRAEAGARLKFDRVGGATRAQTVANGLAALAADAAPADWVLVHDAARPCITAAAIASLISTLADDPIGGLLAVPVADTLKRAGSDGRVVATVPRDALWLAQTPQMFRLGMLRQAYAHTMQATDEAGAMEALGHAPRLCPGSPRNLKVTYAGDFDLAAACLRAAG